MSQESEVMSHGLHSLDRGQATLVDAAEGLVVEMQTDGVFNGLEPSRTDMLMVYREARGDGRIVGAEEIFLTLMRRTASYHQQLAIEGSIALENMWETEDPLFDTMNITSRQVRLALESGNVGVGVING